MNAAHEDARTGRAQDEARKVGRMALDLNDLLHVTTDRVGECDGCHVDRQALHEDVTQPGEYAYCPGCWGRLLSQAAQRLDRQKAEARRCALLAGLKLCARCWSLGPAGQSCGCFDNGSQ